MKLYPPQINGSIPAFCTVTDNESGKTETKLTVPYTMNKTVGRNEVGGFRLQIKTSHSNTLLATIDAHSWNESLGEAYFFLDLVDEEGNQSFLGQRLMIGSFYKIQLAYINAFDGSIGYYSSVGVTKYTTKPEITISGLDFTKVNMNENTYTGTYSQIGGDLSERVYSYCFNIYDWEGNLYNSSNELLHNSYEDVEIGSSKDEFTFTKDLIINKNYTIQYIVKTINGLTVKSNRYRIMQKESIDPDIRVDIIAKNYPDNGYIEVSLKGHKDEVGVEYNVTGSFVIKRASNLDDYSKWDTILYFKANGKTPSKWTWKDFSIQHGLTYKYAIQQFNDAGLYSNKIMSNEVYASFEDSFLWDGKRQLKLRFNPKISSFKTNILETKTDTIGSQYPFIFRNGYVNYKEFPISGLISYHMDEEELFISKDELNFQEITTKLSDSNIASERIFKLKVLEWLNDGNPKVFRSPSEGNYIVRLMKPTLSPNDTVGRILHTFSTTAYEIDDFSYDALLKWGFIELKDLSKMVTRWRSATFSKYDDQGNFIGTHNVTENMIHHDHIPATSIRIQDVPEKTQIYINHVGVNAGIDEYDLITVGRTGVYNIDLDLGLKIYGVYPLSAGLEDGSVVYSYETNISNIFDTIQDVDIQDIPLRQFLGATNVIDKINNIKSKLLEFTFLQFQKRGVNTIYTKTPNYGEQKKYYRDKDCKYELNKIIDSNGKEKYSFSEIEEECIYKIENVTNDTFVYWDGQKPEVEVKYSNTFTINGSSIDLTETETQLIKYPGEVKTLIMDSGLSLECAYQTREVIYSLETENNYYTNDAVVRARNLYDEKLNRFLNLLRYDTNQEDEYYSPVSGYTSLYFNDLELAEKSLYALNDNNRTAYEEFLYQLDIALQKQKEDSQFNGDSL